MTRTSCFCFLYLLRDLGERSKARGLASMPAPHSAHPVTQGWLHSLTGWYTEEERFRDKTFQVFSRFKLEATKQWHAFFGQHRV